MLADAPTSSSRIALADWFHGPLPLFETIHTSEPLGWNGVGMQTLFLSPSHEDHGTFYSEYHSLVFVQKGATRLQTRFADGLFSDNYATSGSLMFLPAQQPSNSRWNAPTIISSVLLSAQLGVRVSDSMVRGDVTRLELRPIPTFNDALLYHLVTTLCNEAQSVSPFGNLFAESVSHAIMLHLLRKYSTATIITKTSRAGLSLHQRRVIEHYIDDHLEETITLDDLARALHMSVPHFERMFRAAFHRPPYHYVLERRLDKAKGLLSEGRHSLHEVARLCGFANQSHFTRHFSRKVGISPAKFALHSQH